MTGEIAKVIRLSNDYQTLHGRKPKFLVCGLPDYVLLCEEFGALLDTVYDMQIVAIPFVFEMQVLENAVQSYANIAKEVPK